MNAHVGALMADDSSYKEALARRATILAQMQELQARLKTVNDYVTAYEKLFAKSDTRASEADSDESDTHTKKRVRNVLPPAQLAELCREIIAEVGRPMTRTELLQAIEDRGIPLAGADPSKNLGTILWRARDTFDNIQGRGYWLAGQPVPPA